MKKSMFFIGVLGLFLLLFSGCSMVPDDEEIIRGSILEDEILDNEDMDDETMIINNGDGTENEADEGLILANEEGDENMDSESENSEVLFEVVE